MDQQDFTALGNVTNLHISEESNAHDSFSLHFHLSNGERQQLLFGTGAIRVLWHSLTQILYPRAASSLTSKAATAAISLASSLSAIFALKVVDKTEYIEVIAVSAVKGWSFRFSREEAHELWAVLENTLHNVQGKADE